ncbi:diheme cytochrome c precursor [Pirellulales bacterium]|nr:diheme cytochrome c precursor [Pirellulales bacterium]
MAADKSSRTSLLIAVVVISVAVVGYFTGLQSPMPAPTTTEPVQVDDRETQHAANATDGVIPATHYADMAEATLTRRRHARLTSFESTIDPLAEIRIEPEDKRAALQRREENRAYNGAPPTIPHPIDQRSDAACIACHGDGAKTTSLRIPRMSHALLTNCTQCHVENSPQYLTAIAFRANEFDGMEAPAEGPRSFLGAPPQIPHSTWMRSDCMSCHGHAGLHGIRTTHPWRNNCTQCHAPSAAMDQTLLAKDPQFLPGPKMNE